MTGRYQAKRLAERHAEEVKAQHLLYDVLFGGTAFFACWGLVRCAVVAVNAVCGWLGI